MRLLHFVFVAMLAVVVTAQSVPQSVPVTGAVTNPFTVTRAELSAMPRATINAKNAEGAAVVWQGVWLHEVLKKAGATLGADLKGPTLATYVLVSARDGYRVVYSLAEIDPEFSVSQMLFADTMDGKPIPDAQGPFRLVIATDKKAARSVRMVEKIEVVVAPK